MKVADILKRFGSLSDVRDALIAAGVAPPPTLQAISSWQVKNRLPSDRQKQLLIAARVREIELRPEDFFEAA